MVVHFEVPHSIVVVLESGLTDEAHNDVQSVSYRHCDQHVDRAILLSRARPVAYGKESARANVPIVDQRINRGLGSALAIAFGVVLRTCFLCSVAIYAPIVPNDGLFSRDRPTLAIAAHFRHAECKWIPQAFCASRRILSKQGAGNCQPLMAAAIQHPESHRNRVWFGATVVATHTERKNLLIIMITLKQTAQQARRYQLRVISGCGREPDAHSTPLPGK